MSTAPLVDPGVLDAIESHVRSASARKVGGILVGGAVDDAVRVQGSIAARETEDYAGEIAFPAPVWEEAYRAIDRFPGSRIVGWYHSHPGTGTALSEYDRRMHAALFGEPHNLALVLDPVADRVAWYGWQVAELGLVDGAEQGPSTGVIPAPARPGRGRRAAVVGLVVLGLAGSGAIGYLIGTDHPADDTAIVRRLSRQVEDQQREMARVQALLLQAERAMAEELAQLRSVQQRLDATKQALAEARRKLREARHQAPTSFVLHYTVQPGDTLWSLAERFYGDPFEWTTILQANAGRVSDPNNLAAGQVLDIPLTNQP